MHLLARVAIAAATVAGLSAGVAGCSRPVNTVTVYSGGHAYTLYPVEHCQVGSGGGAGSCTRLSGSVPQFYGINSGDGIEVDTSADVANAGWVIGSQTSGGSLTRQTDVLTSYAHRISITTQMLGGDNQFQLEIFSQTGDVWQAFFTTGERPAT